MQQVKFKAHSMGFARYGNDDDYYLQSIDSSGYAVLTVIRNGKLYPLCCLAIELEVVTHDVTLPVVELSDDDIRAMWIDAGGTILGLITQKYTMTEERIIEFIRSIR